MYIFRTKRYNRKGLNSSSYTIQYNNILRKMQAQSHSGKTVLFLYVDENVSVSIRGAYQKAIEANENEVSGGERFRDSGFDLYCPETIQLDRDDYNASKKKPITLNHKVKVACYFVPNGGDRSTWIPLPYYLYPRSSISKTPFRMANSVGIIDAGYRGDIMGKLDWLDNGENLYRIEKGTRLFQLCAYNLFPFDVIQLVESEEALSEVTKRGYGGFGSTD